MTEKTISNQLRHQASAQGYLLIDDLLAALPGIKDDVDQLEKILDDFENQGIAIYSDQTKVGKPDDVFEIKNESQAAPKTVPAGVEPDALPFEDPLELYFREMYKVPLLTHDQEITLAKQVEKGRQASEELNEGTPPNQEARTLQAHIETGQQARQHLIRANIRLVVSVAKKYMGHGVPLADLIQEGNFGLMRAVKKFDYRRGYRFSTYATWWIRQAVTRALAFHSRVIRLPVHTSDNLRQVHRVSARLQQDLGRKPTPDELAVEMKQPVTKIERLLRAGRFTLSLEEPVDGDDDRELGDFIKDEETPPPIEHVSRHFLREDLGQVLATLTAREAKVISLRFGLDNGERFTLAEIGQKLKLTRERVRQIEHQALRRLRHPSRTRPLKEYLEE
jgi:RNA polymerase primary sigma factor